MVSRTRRNPSGQGETRYETLMAEIELALSRVARAVTAEDCETSERQHQKARDTYQRLVELHPTLTLEPSQRELLLDQLAELRSRLEESEGRV
jgi:fido (protein-threonine AMPylation protein)